VTFTKSDHDHAYKRGVDHFKAGGADINPYCQTDLRIFCAWSAGYFDAKRGYV